MDKNNKIFAGLGNPGAEYEKTYHNAGKIAVAEILRELESRFPEFQKGSYKHFSYAKFPGIVLVIPNTYMNESGLAVKEALDYFEAEPKDLVLLHDESDLPFGEVRESKESGSAGHRGVQSVIDALQTKDFERIRIGIREELGPAAGRIPAGEFVLKQMSSAELDALRTSLHELIRKVIEKT